MQMYDGTGPTAVESLKFLAYMAAVCGVLVLAAVGVTSLFQG